MTFLTRTHIDVCDVLSRQHTLTEERRKIYVNLLRAHSVLAREITAAVSLINAGRIKVRRLVSVAKPEGIEALVPLGILVEMVDGPLPAFLDLKHAPRFLVKAIAHRIFRLWPASSCDTDHAVRAWVELSESIYPDVHRNGTILIYPFYLNVTRQIRYIRHCRRMYPNVLLTGLPYSISSFFSDLIRCKNRDIAFINAEFLAFRQHADEIFRYARKTLSCNDEFDAGVVTLANSLKSKGVRVINTSHGLSFGSPYVGYNEFVVYNSAQKSYYEYRSPGTKYRVQVRRNASETEALAFSRKFRPIVLLMHGNFTRDDLRFERQLERSIVRQLSSLCGRLKLDFKVKLHPNAIREDVRIFESIEGVETIRHLNELVEADPIFVATITTALYDFYRDGPFLFVNDGVVTIEDIYGYPYPSVDLNELDVSITDWVNLNSYQSALTAQVEAIEAS